mmetsp:Transcript_12797/g.22657  ORF Transcript_12797/g.22657 Transcript_12797/m.22657 type:complete len:623 (+) Transcript_12797:62-1930(+)|eukprot:CAMPEP_0197655784 /NCGR_PEP_ID=MMETSP1338-20131121/39666_1 /TAXON_ID=43686 ORGANISM="Pelagodinium beii, Strain RCC1491" /NCGR_SAMPLE_ID=MMETSP1338 /ASSEMBLY_ACC=CAM_ASM_000754 /LENGTH=622 /DNA_ID=CAMNT_0043231501 /DNA_START=54 /DNA_END=1922 /DNA_ORIENTATION=-
MDKDSKLITFLDSLGPDTDVDFATQMLEAHDWDLQAALETVTGGAGATSQGAPPQLEHGFGDVDVEGYRAPMRTGYSDRLIGPPSPTMQDDLSVAMGLNENATAQFHRREQDAFAASAADFSRHADQQEQAALAEAMQASYAFHMQDEGRRLAERASGDSQDQQQLNHAIEASYQVQNAADAQFRQALELSKQMAQNAGVPTSPTSRSPTSATAAHSLAQPSASAAHDASRVPNGVRPSVPYVSSPTAARSLRRPRSPTLASPTAAGPSAATRLRSGSGGAASSSAPQPVPNLGHPATASSAKVPTAHPRNGRAFQDAGVPAANKARGRDYAAELQAKREQDIRDQKARDTDARAREQAARQEQERAQAAQAARELQEREARQAAARAAREAQERAAREAQEQAAREAHERAAREAQDRAREAQERAAQVAAAREAKERALREAEERAARQAQERAEAETAARDKKAKEAEAAAAAERFAAREAEELRREKEEAEKRKQEAEAPALAKDADPVVVALQALRRLHQQRDPGALATCLQVLQAYIGNLAKNPQEPKFQSINCENANFRSKVAALEGSIAVLEACGFVAQGTTLVVSQDFIKTKGPKLWDALNKVDVMLQQVKRS